MGARTSGTAVTAATSALARPLLLLVAAVLLATAVLAGAGPASAATPSPSASGDAGASSETINAIVTTADGEKVPGADVTVTADGKDVATGTTAATGIARIAVPGPGSYTVTLDLTSLTGPGEGLEPTRGASIDTVVEAGSARAVGFRLSQGGAGPQQASTFLGADLSLAPQLFATGLSFALIIALAAIGLSLIFGTTGLTNFAHGELITFGGLVTYLLSSLGLPVLAAIVVGVVLAGAFGWLNDRALWQPLRRRGTGLIAMMIVSIGLSLLLRYLFLYLFGGGTRFYPEYNAQGPVGFLGDSLRLRPVDLITMGLSVVVLLLVALALLRTRLGKAARAVSDNPALASASGIDVDRVIRTVWIGGAALAGLAGIFLGLQQGLNYLMGFQVLLLVFAAVTLGGLGTAFGAIVGSLVVGVFVQVSTLWVPTELANVGALVILIVILLVRPQGILGRAQRVG